MSHEFTVTGSEVVLDAPIIAVRRDQVVMPGGTEAAREIVAEKKNVRLLVTGGLPDPAAPGDTFRSVAGGFLVQGRDTARLTAADLKVVTKRAPTEAEPALYEAMQIAR